MLRLGRGSHRNLCRTFSSLPIIDIGPLVNPTSAEKDKLAVSQQLHEACRDVGFFYVANHGVPPTVKEGVLREARKWFALPLEQKLRIALRPETQYRGYQQLGDNVTRYDGGFQRDWHEAIDLYREVDPSLPQDIQASPLHGMNQWPSQVPSFEVALRAYVASCLSLGANLLRGIARGLGVEEDYFERAEAGRTTPSTSYWTTRVIHYPPLSLGDFHQEKGGIHHAAAEGLFRQQDVERDVQLSCGEHADYGLLTLVNQEDHMTALQVKNAAGHWVNADPVPGTFVCNIGEMFRYWTDGVYTPTAHRVINADPTRSRVSIPFFYEPSFDAVARPLPHFTGRGPGAPCPEMRFGSYLESKVFTNFELELPGSELGAA